MNITTTLLQNKMKALVIAFAVILLGFFIGFLTTNTSAIPYNGEDTTPSPVPAFNVYTGVPGVGNESDFYKGKLDGSTEDSVNNIESTCETGTRFSLRAYVHNGASQYENAEGNGPSVAKDTTVKMTVPTNEGSNFGSTATISSSNAGSISDGLTITCTDGRTVTVKYVVGSAEQYSGLSGVQPVSDSIVTTGAPIGTMSPNGDVWGCWDQRVWVRIVVEVTEVPEDLHPAVCEAILTTLLSSNQIRVDNVEFDLRDATLNDIEIDYGDTTKVNVQPDDFALDPHTYTNPGTYTVRATLNTTFEGKADAISSPACEAKIEVPEDKETPVYACTDPKFVLEGSKATFSFIPTALNGAVFDNANILYFSNGNEVNSDTTDVVNSDGRVVSMYTFADNAVNVSANATLRFNVGEEVKEVKCGGEGVLGVTTPPVVTPPVTTLPNTGAGSAIAIIFAATAAVGGFAHRAMTLKRQ
jgi:hypothetical protein